MYSRALEIEVACELSTRDHYMAASSADGAQQYSGAPSDDWFDDDDLGPARGISYGAAIGAAIGLVMLWLALQWLPLIVDALRHGSGEGWTVTALGSVLLALTSGYLLRRRFAVE
jgi:hypothetical protein